MSDPNNTTIGPGAARRSGTRIMRAINAEAERKSAARAQVDPHLAFWQGAARNVVGFVILGWAAIKLNAALTTSMKDGYALSKVDALRFGVPIAAVLVAGLLLAPSLTFTVLRFLGFGGIIDKLPFVKKAAAEPPPS